jgi:hypothetical protein
MSQKCIEMVIGRIATDEALRARFVGDPFGTLQSLRAGGVDLNPAEVEALLAMPVESWDAIARWIHPRLQKIALQGDGHAS